ncbi:hypothetical protein PROPEN_04177 [Proteus penneri ATCC 35198]|nr:hypothetical protein PROPEN_04177 [Proteus penneri ATCC 35198]
MRAIVPSTTTKWDIFSYFSYLVFFLLSVIRIYLLFKINKTLF